MPHDSFFKLDVEKREKILNAMEKEFGSNSFEKSSINKIVEEAGISKGSFWFYFDNKEEAINYMIESHIEKEKELALTFLSQNHGDIFETYIGIFDHMIKNKPNEDKKQLIPNICKELIVNNTKIFHQRLIPPRIEEKLIEEERFMNLLDVNLKEKYSKEEIFALLKFLNYALRTNLVECLSGGIEEENARKNFLRELEILKK